ncbi:MAG: HD family phosphohydrolase [Phycisphaerae bacterium]
MTWPYGLAVLFLVGVAMLPLFGGSKFAYFPGQWVGQPIYAQVDFQVRDLEQTKLNREAARAATPSYYLTSASALTVDRIRADLMSVYQAAADAETFDTFSEGLVEKEWPVDQRLYRRLREWVELPEDAGRTRFEAVIKRLPLAEEYVVRDWYKEQRTPKSTRDFVFVLPADGKGEPKAVKHTELVLLDNNRALSGSAANVAKRLLGSGAYEMSDVVEKIVYDAFSSQPTVRFDLEKTNDAMRQAERDVADAVQKYAKGDVIVPVDTIIGSTDIDVLRAHHNAFQQLLGSDVIDAQTTRLRESLRIAGFVILIVLVAAALLVYAHMHQEAIFEGGSQCISFFSLLIVTIAMARFISLQWPQYPGLLLLPVLLTASVFSIVYPRRFAVGSLCCLALLVTMIVQADLIFLLMVLTAVATAAVQLTEVRSRTKFIEAGLVTSLCVTLVSVAGDLEAGVQLDAITRRATWAGGSALLAFFVASGLLPFIERAFRVATSLTLLEWRDPTRELLQLLAREAPGTYNHSLVLGTLAEAACNRIGANGLLAQVGALYHDIGKIHKADYFVENQEGGINRHDNLSPSMSLLIIVGHVKDGIEMAKEYKLPSVLRQFIEEHHGTTVVRYFHHMATEQQPKIASGKHDREVPEAEFRYAGPKPRTRESAVVMLCDGVEGAVRALNEPTVGRIESVVHQVVQSRVNDGQLSDCDMTMREIQLVEDSLVKTLCSIYHGRVAYPKAAGKPAEPVRKPEKMSV